MLYVLEEIKGLISGSLPDDQGGFIFMPKLSCLLFNISTWSCIPMHYFGFVDCAVKDRLNTATMKKRQ